MDTAELKLGVYFVTLDRKREKKLARTEMILLRCCTVLDFDEFGNLILQMSYLNVGRGPTTLSIVVQTHPVHKRHVLYLNHTRLRDRMAEEER